MAIGLLATVVCARAQETGQNEPRFLFSKENGIRVSGFGAPIVEFSSVNDQFAVSTGGGGAVLINQTFFIGAYGMGLATDQPRYTLTALNESGIPVTYNNYRPMLGHGGFWLGYIHNSHRMVHWSVSTKIGWGAVSLIDPEYRHNSKDLGWDGVFVFNPQAELEINLITWFKMNLGVGWRWVKGVEATYTNANGLNLPVFESFIFDRPTVSLSLLFGNFTK